MCKTNNVLDKKYAEKIMCRENNVLGKNCVKKLYF